MLTYYLLLYLLNQLYEEVYIYKPKTSRTANSEKYFIAKGFKGINKTYYLLKDIKYLSTEKLLAKVTFISLLGY